LGGLECLQAARRRATSPGAMRGPAPPRLRASGSPPSASRGEVTGSTRGPWHEHVSTSTSHAGRLHELRGTSGGGRPDRPGDGRRPDAASSSVHVTHAAVLHVTCSRICTCHGPRVNPVTRLAAAPVRSSRSRCGLRRRVEEMWVEVVGAPSGRVARAHDRQAAWRDASGVVGSTSALRARVEGKTRRGAQRQRGGVSLSVIPGAAFGLSIESSTVPTHVTRRRSRSGGDGASSMASVSRVACAKRRVVTDVSRDTLGTPVPSSLPRTRMLTFGVLALLREHFERVT